MKIKPIFTEKSMKDAKNGAYTFGVLPKYTKWEIKKVIEKVFGVKVEGIRTLNYKKNIQKNLRGRNKVKKSIKKILVTLKSGKIDLFEETK